MAPHGGVATSDATRWPSFTSEARCWPTGWRRDVLITIDGRRIVGVDAGVAAPAGAERLAGIAVPGLANLHSHAFQRAMAGLAERRGPEDDSFWTWREVMYRFLARMTPDDVEAIAALAYVEMLEAGFTARRRVPLPAPRAGRRRATPTRPRWPRASSRRPQATGIGLTLLPCFYAHGGFGGAPPTPGQRASCPTSTASARCWRRAAGTSRRLDGAVLGIAPHSLRAVDAGELRALVERWPAGPDPHPRRRADERGGGLPRLVRRAAGRMAARPHAAWTRAGA